MCVCVCKYRNRYLCMHVWVEHIFVVSSVVQGLLYLTGSNTTVYNMTKNLIKHALNGVYKLLSFIDTHSPRLSGSLLNNYIVSLKFIPKFKHLYYKLSMSHEFMFF